MVCRWRVYVWNDCDFYIWLLDRRLTDMTKDLNTCKTLGDFIEAAICIYEDSGKTLTVEQAFSEGKRLQDMWNGEPLEKAKAAKEDAMMIAN